MSETIENQLAHRSVRRFDAQPISPEVLAHRYLLWGANGFDYSGQ